MTLGRREADSHRRSQGLGDPHLSHRCEGDVMPVLQMRKLRPLLSQDDLTWRQGRPGPLMANCLRPAWRTCSLPPPPTHPGKRGVAPRSEGAAGFCSRVRLALLQGLSQLPGASQADCLPPPEEGSLLSGLISCQLSVFFLCFCCNLRQTDGVGRPEKQGFQSRAFPGLGTSALSPAPFCGQALSRPLSSRLLSSLLHTETGPQRPG